MMHMYGATGAIATGATASADNELNRHEAIGAVEGHVATCAEVVHDHMMHMYGATGAIATGATASADNELNRHEAIGAVEGHVATCAEVVHDRAASADK